MRFAHRFEENTDERKIKRGEGNGAHSAPYACCLLEQGKTSCLPMWAEYQLHISLLRFGPVGTSRRSLL